MPGRPSDCRICSAVTTETTLGYWATRKTRVNVTTQDSMAEKPMVAGSNVAVFPKEAHSSLFMGRMEPRASLSMLGPTGV